jgi:hypothetical protein
MSSPDYGTASRFGSRIGTSVLARSEASKRIPQIARSQGVAVDRMGPNDSEETSIRS